MKRHAAIHHLVAMLRDPGSVVTLPPSIWPAIISVARAEALFGTLAFRLEKAAVPPSVAALLAATRDAADDAHRIALWEGEMARRALAPHGIEPILLKGTAYAAQGYAWARGRQIGDCDVLIPRHQLDTAEAALLEAGWEWVKQDAYDDAYYRQWMHELPPMIHRTRDRMIDVHHTILPLTHRSRPDADQLIANSIPVTDHPGMRTLSPTDQTIHAAAHLFADGDMAGALRNLWDLHHLFDAAARDNSNYELHLLEEAAHHGLFGSVARALRLSAHVFGTAVNSYHHPFVFDVAVRRSDRPFLRRMLARDDWGRETRKLTRFGFYLRGHWMRMPPAMLARHLWAKARR